MKKTITRIDAFDERLPKKTNRQPTEQFIRSLIQYQISPILINNVDGAWELVCGFCRLEAARRGAGEEYGGDGKIDACITQDLSAEEVNALRLIENSLRSPNLASQFAAIQALLKIHGDLKEISEVWNIPIAQLKKMLADWSKVPTWASRAAASGKITTNLAIAVGKAKPSVQELAREQFRSEEKLTQQDLYEFSMVHKKAVAQAAPPLLQFSQTQGRTSVSVFEVRALVDLLRNVADGKATIESAIQMGESILAK